MMGFMDDVDPSELPDDIDLQEALEIAEEIQEMIVDLPYEAEEFGVSVAEQTEEIVADINEKQRVTGRQMNALCNMRDGVSRWFL